MSCIAEKGLKKCRLLSKNKPTCFQVSSKVNSSLSHYSGDSIYPVLLLAVNFLSLSLSLVISRFLCSFHSDTLDLCLSLFASFTSSSSSQLSFSILPTEFVLFVRPQS